VKLLGDELAIIGIAYLMTGIPIGGIMLAGRMSSMYRLPMNDLVRWWSRAALVLVAASLAVHAVAPPV
jgi:hypothetical protein